MRKFRKSRLTVALAADWNQALTNDTALLEALHVLLRSERPTLAELLGTRPRRPAESQDVLLARLAVDTNKSLGWEKLSLFGNEMHVPSVGAEASLEVIWRDQDLAVLLSSVDEDSLDVSPEFLRVLANRRVL
jgi:hypothetical protein